MSDQIKLLVKGIYEARRDRQVNPEGHFDNSGRWYPSESEDSDGSVARTHRSPSRAWPYSYLTACRTRKHCVALVARALEGKPVPRDVAAAVKATCITPELQEAA